MFLREGNHTFCAFSFTEQTDRPRPSSRTDPRAERDQQFAPPAFYYEEKPGGQTTKNTRKEPPKPQLPWQPNFPFNVPPPALSAWQPNMPPWQPPQGPPPMVSAPFPNPHAAWYQNPSNSNASLLGRGQESDCTPAESAENVKTGSEPENSRERTVPSTQQVADFVAQFRS